MARLSRDVTVKVLALACLVFALCAAPAMALPNRVLELPFDEGKYHDAWDWSGKGNNGTLSSGTRWTQAGRFGGAVSFDGDDRVTVPDSPSLDFVNTGFTIMAWVRPRRLNQWQSVIIKDNGSQTIPYALYATRDATAPNTSAPTLWGGGAQVGTGTGPVAQNAWTHLAGTFDGTNYKLYVNGTLVMTRPGTAPMATQQALGIGNNAMWPTGEGFDGLIDEVRAYDGPLTAAEVIQVKDTRIGDAGLDVATPVMAMAFDEGTGTIAHDTQGRNRHEGTITGARWTTTARWGKALMFDGVDDLITVPDDDTLDLRDEMTISAWVKPRTTRPYQVLAIKEAPYWRTFSLDVTDNGSVLTAEMGSSNKSTSWLYGPVLTAGKWSHVAYTFDGRIMRLYVNGDKVAEASGLVPGVSEEVLRLGGTRKDPNEHFDGVMDEVRLYDKALPIEQVRRDRDTSIVRDAIAAFRTPGDGSVEPQGFGSPTASSESSLTLTPEPELTTAAASTETETAPSAGALRTTTTTAPEVKAVRRGSTVTVAITGARRGQMRVALSAAGRRNLGTCSGRVGTSGRFTCRVKLRRGAAKVRKLRAVATLIPVKGKAQRATAAVTVAKGG